MKILSIAATFLITTTFATIGVASDFDESYSAVSPNGRYKVEAKSRYNRDREQIITYKLTDLKSKRTQWRRKPEENEGFWSSLHVDNDGWVAIFTHFEDLIFVNPKGHTTGTIDLLRDSFTEKEQEAYVVYYSHLGSYWEDYSLWYFLRIGDLRLFVIRPYWDRRSIMNVETGALVIENDILSEACLAHEKDFVLSHLKKGIDTLELQDGAEIRNILNAVYLAGKLQLTQTIPLIRSLEDSSYSSGLPVRMWFEEKIDNEVDPTSAERFDFRQVAALSLRRLGEIPRQVPIYQFLIRYEDHEKDDYYKAPLLSRKRHTRVDELRVGMKAREVLELVGSPDFLTDSDNWEYDIDDETPYSLILLWKKFEVKAIERISPPFWKNSKKRDKDITSLF